jgi:hypothetical protein
MELPWIITFGPLSDDDEWDPVVCGPYERPHALALAESVVADEDLMAVVEPLQPHVSVDQIRGDIAAARLAAEAEEDEEFEEDEDEEFEEFEEDEDEDSEEFEDEEDEDEEGQVHVEVDEEADEDGYEPTPPPTPEEVRAGFGRIAAKLSGG